MSLEEYNKRLIKDRQKRILSIQSHVVHGYAGNKASVFPLQIHGFEVDFINSVQFSNHAGTITYLAETARYKQVTGQRLSDMDLKELYDGLKLNSINDYSYILTGYCGNSSFLTTIADIVNDIKTKNKQCVFVCDPVMGDNGKYYTPKDMMPVYRDVIVPIADILTPNAFELGELTGIKINCENDCFNAIDDLHKKGVSIVVVTSGVTDLEQDDDVLHCYASVQTSIMQKTQYRFTFPRLKGAYVGTGDVFTSLLVAWIDEVGDLAESVRNVIGSMQSLIKTTYDYAIDNASENTTAKCELKLIQSRKYLLFPPDLTNIHVDKING